MRMRLIVIACLLPAAAATAQAPVRFGHYPALSADGSKLVFEWCRDIFIADVASGVAAPLTMHHASDTRPVFAEGGAAVVFMSNRSGNWDLYRMPVGGGEPQRLTYYSGTDGLWEMSPDGGSVIFESRRNGPLMGGFGYAFTLPLTGGTPTRYLPVAAGDVATSPDGGKVAFVRSRSDWDWREYKGGLSEDVWIWDKAADSYTKITDYIGPDYAPMWSADGATVFFMSDRSGAYNLWKVAATGGAATQVTSHDQPLRRPTISRDGRFIVYELDGGIHLCETATGATRELSLTGPTDVLEPETFYSTETANMGAYDVAPSGREVAFIVRGDLYVCRFPDGGPTTRLTNTPQSEENPLWSEDSKTIYFLSDRDGNGEIYSITSDDPNEPRLRRAARHKLTRLTETPENETGLVWSPDRKKLAIRRERGQIVVANPDLSEQKVVVDGQRWTDFTWSPDSRWLAITRADADSNNDVFIVSAEGGELHNISMHPANDSDPVFAGDMSRLVFRSSRRSDEWDLYYVWLRREDWVKTRADRDLEEDIEYDKPEPPEQEEPQGAAPAEGGEASESEEEQPEPEPEPARIEFEDIHERLVTLTRSSEPEFSLVAAPTGKQIAFVGAAPGTGVGPGGRFGGGGTRSLMVADLDEFEPRTVASGSVGGVEYSRDGRQLRFLSGGQLSQVAVQGGPQTTVSHSARVERRIADERAYVFDQVWQVQRDNFYDVNMHGVDWDAMREFYKPRALSAPSREDFALVVNQMLGELKASHQGYGIPGRGVEATGPPAAALGLAWTDDRTGPGFVVAAVEPDTPADTTPNGPKAGERVLSIDGTALGPGVNDFALLVAKDGELVTLEIEGADGARRTVSVRATSSGGVAGTRRETWLRNNRRLVAEWSNGRLGYLQVPGMNQGAVQEFYRDLFAAGAGKEGLLIDVRFNGGGNTHEYLLEALTFRPHTYMVDRGTDERGFPAWLQPVPVYRHPTVVLHNQHSASDAELFSWAYKNLGLGKTVGTPTWGGVIFTGSAGMVDGSSCRVPGTGAYMMDGTNLEMKPVPADVPVEISPADEAAGRDPQLEAAVRTLLEQIDSAR